MSGYPSIPPAFVDPNPGGGPTVSSYIQEKNPELANKLNAMGEICRYRDAVNAQWVIELAGGQNPFTFDPCLGSFTSLLSQVESWYKRDDLKFRKRDLANTYVFGRNIVETRDELIEFMRETGKEPDPEFYETWETLNNYKMVDSFDKAFNGNGVFDTILSSPDSYYASDTGIGFSAEDKESLELDVVYNGPEWNRVEDEKQFLFNLISNHLDWFISGNDITIDSLLKTDIPFATNYNKY